jgi:RNA polymerase primary sigma factor
VPTGRSESVSDLERRPGVTGQREQNLIVAAEAGDTEACRRLVELFLPAIVALARQYDHSAGVERQELVQEGVAGLLFAARRYDPSLNTPFWAYASFWVRKAMQELVAELTRPVVLSDRAVRMLAELRAARRAYVQTHRCEPTNVELSSVTGLTLAQIDSLAATDRVPRAFEETLGTDEEVTTTVGEMIVDPLAEREYEQVLDKIELHQVRGLADQLRERERTVLLAHYGLGQTAQTLSQIGAGLGLTAERARQIELDALTKLRAALARPAPVGMKPT